MDRSQYENVVSTFSKAPFHEIIPMRLSSVEDGRVEVYMEIFDTHLQSLGRVQGGIITSLLDAAAGHAALTKMPATSCMVTSELTVHFMRSAFKEEGSLYCVGEVLSSGKKAIIAEACLYGRDRNVLLAKLVGTFFVLPK